MGVGCAGCKRAHSGCAQSSPAHENSPEQLQQPSKDCWQGGHQWGRHRGVEGRQSRQWGRRRVAGGQRLWGQRTGEGRQTRPWGRRKAAAGRQSRQWDRHKGVGARRSRLQVRDPRAEGRAGELEGQRGRCLCADVGARTCCDQDHGGMAVMLDHLRGGGRPSAAGRPHRGVGVQRKRRGGGVPGAAPCASAACQGERACGSPEAGLWYQRARRGSLERCAQTVRESCLCKSPPACSPVGPAKGSAGAP